MRAYQNTSELIKILLTVQNAYTNQHVFYWSKKGCYPCHIVEIRLFYALVDFGENWDKKWVPFSLLLPVNEGEISKSLQSSQRLLEKRIVCKTASIDMTVQSQLEKFVGNMPSVASIDIDQCMTDIEDGNIVLNDFNEFKTTRLKEALERREIIWRVKLEDLHFKQIDEFDKPAADEFIRHGQSTTSICVASRLNSFLRCGLGTDFKLSIFAQASISVLLMTNVSESDLLREIF